MDVGLGVAAGQLRFWVRRGFLRDRG